MSAKNEGEFSSNHRYTKWKGLLSGAEVPWNCPNKGWRVPYAISHGLVLTWMGDWITCLPTCFIFFLPSILDTPLFHHNQVEYGSLYSLIHYTKIDKEERQG